MERSLYKGASSVCLAVTSFTTYELPLVAAMAHDGTGIKLDEQTRFSNPVLKERLGQLSWFKQANQALAGLKDAASNFMAGPPRVEAKELQLDDARWSALFTKAPPRFASLSTQAEATAKLPHNSSTEELTKFLRDHSEGEHLDRLRLARRGHLLQKRRDGAPPTGCVRGCARAQTRRTAVLRVGTRAPQVRGAAAPRDADPGPAQGGLVEAAAVEAPW